MILFRLFFSFLCSVSCCFLSAFAVDHSPEQFVERQLFEYVLPVRHGENGHIVLIVRLPDSFKVTHEESKKKNVLFHFIPYQEEMDHWSEMITIQKTPLPKGGVLGFMRAFKESFVANFANTQRKQAELSIREEQGVPVASFTVEFPAVQINIPGQSPRRDKSKYEIKMVKGIEGDSHIWTIHYSYRYDNTKVSDKERQEVTKKMQGFLDSCKLLLTSL